MQYPKGKAPVSETRHRGSACSRAWHPCQVYHTYYHSTTWCGSLSSGFHGCL